MFDKWCFDLGIDYMKVGDTEDRQVHETCLRYRMCGDNKQCLIRFEVESETFILLLSKIDMSLQCTFVRLEYSV